MLWYEGVRTNIPEVPNVFLGKRLAQARLLPQSPGKRRIVDLESVVDADGFALFRAARRRNQGECLEEGDVVPAQGARPKALYEHNLGRTGRQWSGIEV